MRRWECGGRSGHFDAGTAAAGVHGRQQEDDMSDTTPALDEAFERMAAASFELPNGFVNHGAMACEALAVLDCTDDIDSWARRFARAGRASVDPLLPAGFEWRQALGDYPASPLPHAGDLRIAVVRAAAAGAPRYLARPDIVPLHRV